MIRAEAAAARIKLAGLSPAGRSVLVAATLAVVVSFVARIATLAQPLVEAHAFRQTQTAYTAVIYHRQGIDLLQTPLPVLGPPWVVPFEFPLFQAIAALVMDVGVSTEVALRSTSLFFFVVCVVLVWKIVRLEVDARTAAVAVVAFMLAPLGLLWSRTSLIETFADAAALATVLEAIRWDRGGSRAHLMAAMALGALAALLKITTAAIWLFPAVLLLRRSRAMSIVIVAIAAAAGLAWTGYADSIKAASPATAWLTSGMLRTWNFGTIHQRLAIGTWRTVILGWAPGLGLSVLLAPLAVRNRIAVWALATLVSGPLIFTNLYFVHDYYWMAVAPAAAILVGEVVGRASRIVSDSGRRASLIGLTALFVLSFFMYTRWEVMFDPHAGAYILDEAAQVRAATSPQDLVAIKGSDTWGPEILFYADRRGYMEDARIPPAPPGYVHFTCVRLPTGRGSCVRQ